MQVNCDTFQNGDYRNHGGFGGYSGNSFFALLGDGHRYGLDIRYAYQEQAGGIAEALRLTEGFVGERDVAVILGDNVFEKSMKEHSDAFLNDSENECYLFLKPVNDPGSFGIAWIDSEGSIVNMEEKPSMILIWLLLVFTSILQRCSK